MHAGAVVKVVWFSVSALLPAAGSWIHSLTFAVSQLGRPFNHFGHFTPNVV